MQQTSTPSSAAADTWQATASVDDAPSSGRHGRRDAGPSLSGLVQRPVELVLGILHAVHPSSGCGQRSLDVARKVEKKVQVLQQQGVAMQPVVHHASAPPLEGIPAVMPITRLRVGRRRQTTPRHHATSPTTHRWNSKWCVSLIRVHTTRRCCEPDFELLPCVGHGSWGKEGGERSCATVEACQQQSFKSGVQRRTATGIISFI